MNLTTFIQTVFQLVLFAILQAQGLVQVRNFACLRLSILQLRVNEDRYLNPCCPRIITPDLQYRYPILKSDSQMQTDMDNKLEDVKLGSVHVDDLEASPDKSQHVKVDEKLTVFQSIKTFPVATAWCKIFLYCRYITPC